MWGPQHPALTWVLFCMPEMVPWELRWLESPFMGVGSPPAQGHAPKPGGNWL